MVLFKRQTFASRNKPAWHVDGERFAIPLELPSEGVAAWRLQPDADLVKARPNGRRQIGSGNPLFRRTIGCCRFVYNLKEVPHHALGRR